MKRWQHIAIKMSLANLLAIALAYLFSLSNPITAGILAVLSIQLTKTDSLNIALKRLLDAMIALALGTFFFYLFGYTVIIFIVFTPVFIALSHLLKLEAGIVPSLVLASQLLLFGAFSLAVILNALALIVIAIVVALGLHLLYPLNSTKALLYYTKKFDSLLQSMLKIIVDNLRDKTISKENKTTYDDVVNALNEMLKEAETADKDILFTKSHQPLDYIKMRYAQLKHLKRLYKLTENIDTEHPYQYMISDYLEALIPDIGQEDRATAQKEKLETLLDNYRKKPLPETRTAFETRAILYQMIFEIDAFLQEKITYHQNYSRRQ